MQRKINSIRGSYKIYKESSRNPVTKDFYIEICNNFMKFIFDKLIEEGSIILPNRLGQLYITGRKIKPKFEDGRIINLAPDWAKTKLLWSEDEEAKENKTIVYHTNDNTNGVRYKCNWYKSRIPITNKTLYNFILTRANKRALAKKIKEGKEYTILENGKKHKVY